MNWIATGRGSAALATMDLASTAIVAIPHTSRLRKKAFRTLLSLAVISPKGGELNTSGAERRSELTSPRGANLKGRKPVLSQGAERFSIKKLVFPHPANARCMRSLESGRATSSSSGLQNEYSIARFGPVHYDSCSICLLVSS